MNKLLVGIGVLVYLAGVVAIARPVEQVAQRQQKPQDPPSGARLIFQEKSRDASPSGDFIKYVLRTDGLPESKSYSLIGKWMNGKTGPVPEELHIDKAGRVMRKDGDELELVLGGTFPGEFIRFALVSADGAAKAFGEITPVPIEAVGKGGCRLLVKPMSIKGEVFSIIGAGFKPDEKIKAVATSSGEKMNSPIENKGGNLKLVLFPAVVGRTGGNASLTASDSSCSVTVHYAWGDAMTKLSPTANQAAPEAQPTSATSLLPVTSPTSLSPSPVTTPQVSRGVEQLKLALDTVNLDHKIALINAFLPHVKDSLQLGKETITHENAKDVLQRLQGERKAFDEEIDREGFSNIAGEYEWQGTQSECKLAGLPSDSSGRVTVVQDGHAVEFKGKGPSGCGVTVGEVILLEAGECGKISPTRLLGRTHDRSIKMLLFAPGSDVRCDAGVLTKR